MSSSVARRAVTRSGPMRATHSASSPRDVAKHVRQSSSPRGVERTIRARPSRGWGWRTTNIHTERMTPTKTYYGDDFCVVEHD
jgi:hypothetical protein